MDYKIIYGFGACELEKIVMEEMAEGWRPRGGVSVVHSESGSPRFVQAMTREPLLPAKAVQKILKKLGSSPGKRDGKWGPKTLAALNKLRAKLKMGPVGKYERTSDALLRQLR
ncbi:MAG: peptidoglycan-binding protein [Alphaproteobacteria bacterium]|nr:peptidoglycan-binding protein [Alphaproteobacteria bacterium]